MISEGLLVATTSLILAASPMQCEMRSAPKINVIPVTNDIQYDFSKTDAELTAMGSDTVNPYGPGVDLVTKGLRHEKPSMQYRVQFGSMLNKRSGQFCVWYDQVDVDITLSPKIYIAKGYTTGECGKFILEHEKKHVLVDRQVMNKYSKKIGEAILKSVNATGALGPFDKSRVNTVRDSMTKHIGNIIDPIVEQMNVEMKRRQQAIDSREEYDAGAKVCRNVSQDMMRNALEGRY